ncbi:MAG: hypothetical protein RRZ42_05270 [Oscillospiraceae bacterium]
MGYMLVIGVYLAILIIGGFIMSKKKVKNSEDFVVAGRRLPMIILVAHCLPRGAEAAELPEAPA